MSTRRLAVLGGGMASLSAVYALTSRPDWQDELDITVYQLGWRLGGKAASGRAREAGNRTMADGIHTLLGFSDNAFAVMRDCYRELRRPADGPLAEFCAATAEAERANPHRYAVRRHYIGDIAETFNDRTYHIPFSLPANALVPGDGTSVDPRAVLTLAMDTLLKRAPGSPSSMPPAWTHEEFDRIVATAEVNVDRWLAEPEPLQLAGAIWHKMLDAQPAGARARTAEHIIVTLVKAHVRQLWAKSKAHIHDAWITYRSWIIQDFLASNVCGMLADEVLVRGFTQLNNVTYADWWMSHAAVPEGAAITAQSTLGEFPYDLVFGDRHDDTLSPTPSDNSMWESPDIEAGTMLIGLFHYLLAYKGAPEWRLQAGSGEALVAPMYHVLENRGVKFEFFSRVRNLHLDAAGKSIASITIERQATAKSGAYDPTYDVGGVSYWPTEPLYDQLLEGYAIKKDHANLESLQTDWEGRTYSIERGTDFDDVLLGIPIGALPGVTKELAAASPRWKAMLASEPAGPSIVGSSESRMNAGGSGFNNLYLTGDWVQTVINADCIEAAVTAGLEAAAAIAGGHRSPIAGQRDWKTIA